MSPYCLFRRSQAHGPVRQLLHGGNMRLLSGRDRQAALQLIQRHGCSYIFQDWPHAGTRDGEKKKLMQAVRAYTANSASVQDVEQARLGRPLHPTQHLISMLLLLSGHKRLS